MWHKIFRIIDWIILDSSTLELARLNELWERFNNGENTKEEVLNQKWKYHKDKALLLIEFHNLRCKQ